jgi:hypothetical protein
MDVSDMVHMQPFGNRVLTTKLKNCTILINRVAFIILYTASCTLGRAIKREQDEHSWERNGACRVHDS